MLEIKSETLHDFDEEVFPVALEIKEYFKNIRDYNMFRKFICSIFKNQIKSEVLIYNEENTFAQKINLIINFTKYFIKIDNFAADYIRLIKNSLFNDIVQIYDKKDLILGGYDKYIELIKNGEFYENFKPSKTKFSGFPIKLGFEEINNIEKFKKKNQFYKTEITQKLKEFNNFKKAESSKGQFDDVNEMTLFTGRFSLDNMNLRTISKINNDKIFNFKKNIFTEEGKEIYYRVPILRGKSLIDASDGFQYSTEKNVIYYYDKFSSNVLGFEYKKAASYSNINCDYYQLANTIETPLTEKDIGKSNILIKLKSNSRY